MKKKLIISVGLPLLLGTVLLLMNQEVTTAQGSGLIRIVEEIHYGTSESPPTINISPEVLTVSKGELVTWFNWVHSAESVNVVLEDKCEDLANVEEGFNKDGPCYFTGWMTLGETSSLRFNVEGVFEYTVEVKTHQGVITYRGRVVVQ